MSRGRAGMHHTESHGVSREVGCIGWKDIFKSRKGKFSGEG